MRAFDTLLKPIRLWAELFIRRKDTNRNCSFCRKHLDDVRLLIAGPGLFICDSCVREFTSVLDGTDSSTFGIATESERDCSFCSFYTSLSSRTSAIFTDSKNPIPNPKRMIESPNDCICAECLQLCSKVVSENKQASPESR
jgi:ATP-dependent protease Clp ATPase subunit